MLAFYSLVFGIIGAVTALIPSLLGIAMLKLYGV